MLLRHVYGNKFWICIVSSLFSIYLSIVNNFKCNYCTIYNLCCPTLKLSSVIDRNVQERVYFNMAEYSPSFVPNLCACHVGLFCIYYVWDVYKFWNGLEWLFNGHDFVYGLFMTHCLHKRFASVHFCIIYFKPRQFFALHSGYDVADLWLTGRLFQFCLWQLHSRQSLQITAPNYFPISSNYIDNFLNLLAKKSINAIN